jgi:hypothetical protein
MALNLVPLAIAEYLYSEMFGQKGLAEMILRFIISQGTPVTDFPYSTANAAALRKAAVKVKETTGETFTFTKQGNSYREVVYNVTRGKGTDKEKTVTMQRKFLNVEAIRVTFVQAEADAAIAADTAKDSQEN